MSRKQLMEIRNRNLQKLDGAYKFNRGVVKIGANESLAHAMTKTKICCYLQRLGVEFVTEAIFKNRVGRADIFVLDKDVAIEVLASEFKGHLVGKAERYCCKNVVGVSVHDQIDIGFVEKLVN